jgi:hypothetical protein
VHRVSTGDGAGDRAGIVTKLLLLCIMESFNHGIVEGGMIFFCTFAQSIKTALFHVEKGGNAR